MLHKKIQILLLFTIMVSGQAAKSQDVEFGVFGGGSYYIGELNPDRQFFFTKPAFGVQARFNLDDRWSVKVGLYKGKIEGDDKERKTNELRNLRFTSPITELSAVVELNYLEYFIGSSNHPFTPYIYAGPGFFRFHPMYGSISLSDLRTEGQTEQYRLLGFAAIFGFGIKYSIGSRLGITLDWGMRKAFTDYLDDVSGNYASFDNNPSRHWSVVCLPDNSAVLHEPGMQRGNPENNDWYSIAGLTLIYRFTIGEKSNCKDFEHSDNK